MTREEELEMMRQFEKRKKITVLEPVDPNEPRKLPPTTQMGRRQFKREKAETKAVDRFNKSMKDRKEKADESHPS